MDPRPSVPVRQRRVWLSPYLLAVALSPAVFQSSTTLSCTSGDTTLSELAVIVDGQDQLQGFEPLVRSYSIALPAGTDEALVHTVSNDPAAQVWIDVVVDGERERYLQGGFGGGDMVVPIPPGSSTIEVWVRAPKGASGVYAVNVEVAEKFLCSEQGILDAIATGGGPHTFDCDGPTTVVTEGEIIIDNDVILDGEGNLTIDGNNDHRVMSVEPGVTAELLGMTVSGGFAPSEDRRGGGILNEGTLTIVDSIIRSNWAGAYPGGHAIYNDGVLTLKNSRVVEHGDQRYSISTIYSVGTLTMVDTQVSNNAGHDRCLFRASGTTTWIRSAVSNISMVQGWPICFEGDATLINSTVSKNYSSFNSGILHWGGTLTLLNSTLVAGPSVNNRDDEQVLSSGNVIMANTVIVDPAGPCTGYDGSATIMSLGGNIESPGNDCGLTDPTDLVNVSAEDLKLGPLADNGGPAMTHALLPGSVAIDHVPASMCVDADGEPLTTDQRGVPRPQGAACDAGAFEWADCSGTACDDGNDCTADYCDPGDDSWCVNNALPDGTFCGTNGVCEGGVCEALACAERSWGTPTLVEANTQYSASEMQVALDDNGQATAVWTHGASISSSLYSPGVGWTAPTLLESDTVVLALPGVAVSSSGQALAVWERYGQAYGEPEQLHSSVYDPNLGWSPAERFDASSTVRTAGLRVASDPSGNSFAVWRGWDPVANTIYSSRYTSVGGWEAPEPIGTGSFPEIAVDALGIATVVWGSGGSVMANRYTPSQGWGSPVPINNSPYGTTPGFKALDADPDGNVIALWIKSDGVADSVWANRYTPSGGWGSPVLLESRADPAFGPQVAMGPNGEAIAGWIQSDGVADSVWANRYTPSGGWGSPVLLESSPQPVRISSIPPTLQLALDAVGCGTAVWTQGDGVADSIFSNRHMPPRGWGAAVLLETRTEPASGPRIVLDPIGSGMALWIQSDGVTDSVWASRFE